jgi:hypothetical protein
VPANLQDLNKIVVLAEPSWQSDLLSSTYLALQGRDVGTPTQPPQTAA